MSGLGIKCICCSGGGYSGVPPCDFVTEYGSVYAFYAKCKHRHNESGSPVTDEIEGWMRPKTGTSFTFSQDYYGLVGQYGHELAVFFYEEDELNWYFYISYIPAYSIGGGANQILIICDNSETSPSIIPFTGGGGESSTISDPYTVDELEDIRDWYSSRGGLVGGLPKAEFWVLDWVFDFGQMWGRVDDWIIEVDIEAPGASDIAEETRTNTTSVISGTGASTEHGWDDDTGTVSRELRMSITDAGSNQYTLEFHYHRWDTPNDDTYYIQDGFEVTVGEGTSYETIDDLVGVSFSFNHDGHDNENTANGVEDADITFTINSYTLT